MTEEEKISYALDILSKSAPGLRFKKNGTGVKKVIVFREKNRNREKVKKCLVEVLVIKGYGYIKKEVILGEIIF